MNITHANNIRFLKDDLSELEKRVSQTIYTIAVVGPSRAGKSTLINCLLRRHLSPVWILPTTGIPITISPRGENSVRILFKDGKSIAGPSESLFLESYTSQENNPDNIKDVSLVTVNIINALLERGIAICDVPGLDDPDDKIGTLQKPHCTASMLSFT